MALQTLNDLDIGAIGDQLSGRAENLKSALYNAAQSKNPLPLSKRDKESATDALVAFGVTSLLLLLVFVFYRAIVKSGVKAALREHHEEMRAAAGQWHHHGDEGRYDGQSEESDPKD